MTREEFNKNSYLVNNNALYNKHTEHISTTEPLYLDGMNGSDNLIYKKSVDDGGNTIEPQTLFAYEEEPNKFIIGEFKGDTLRIQTSSNSNVIWLSSETGVIDGTMSMSAPTLEKILQAVNEKYGTSFEGWSQLPTVYEVSDTVPNWDAYEKIEYVEE